MDFKKVRTFCFEVVAGVLLSVSLPGLTSAIKHLYSSRSVLFEDIF
jgi:hypothetical protein